MAGNSAYIGRVGSLAVALGVGAAVATGHGVAWAEDSSASDSAQHTSTGSSSGATTGTDKSKTDDPSGAAANTTSGTSTTSTGTDTTKSVDPTKTTDPTESDDSSASDDGSDSDDNATEPDSNSESEDNTQPDNNTDPDEVTPPAETSEPEPATSPEPTKNSSSRTGSDTQSVQARITTQTALTTSAADKDTETAVVASPTTEPDDVVVPTAAAAAAATTTTPTQPSASDIFGDVDSITVQTTPPPGPVRTAIRQIVDSVLSVFIGPKPTDDSGSGGPSAAVWGVLAWARREVDDFFAAVTGTKTTTTIPLSAVSVVSAAAAATPNPTTVALPWVTGSSSPNSTTATFSINGTDLGIMWDNGIPDDPTTPQNEHQVLIAFGDTFGVNNTQWRMNVLLRSSDDNLNDGVNISPGVPGNQYSGGVVAPSNFAQQIIANNPSYLSFLGANTSIIPTAGVSIPQADGSVRQYINFMSVRSWDSPGRWTTNYSAIAYSDNNGQTWTVAPSSIRSSGWFRSSTQFITGNQNFQQGAYVRPGDGFVYSYGTPSGRVGSAYLSRVAEADILDVSKYDYWSGSSWVRGNPAAAAPVLGGSGSGYATDGIFGFINNVVSGFLGGGFLNDVLVNLVPVSPIGYVSEMSVQYNPYLNKYVTLYGDQWNNVVIRTSDSPQGGWSAPITLVTSLQEPGLYAPMIHPWSGTDDLENDPKYLYWNLSIWGSYNVKLFRTDLSSFLTV